MPFFGKTGLGNSITRDDIIGFLNLHHVQKLDVSILVTDNILFNLSDIYFINLSSLFRFPLLLCIGKRIA